MTSRKTKSIIGKSDCMVWLRRFALKVAPLNTTVLITGETGTGKELVSDLIQNHSSRANKPFYKINCAAIPDTLFESELFGFEKGAFTGAHTHRRGKFELSSGGTILLDEIGELPLPIQAKLLRIVEQKALDRLGSNKSISIDVRILASTNQNLRELVAKKQFRSDLFHRLNVAFIHVPPLRDRLDDLGILVKHFLQSITLNSMNSARLEISDDAFVELYSHNWPGNIRELMNVLERASLSCEANLIRASDIQAAIMPQIYTTSCISHTMVGVEDEMPHEGLGSRPLKDIVQDTEKKLIIKALHQCQGNQTKAAKLLHVRRKNFWKKIQKHSIDVSSFRSESCRDKERDTLHLIHRAA
jgi:two-component system response regulator AtoC